MAIQKVVAEEVKKALERVKKEIQEVQKDVRQQAKALAVAQARSWAIVVAEEPPKKLIPGRLSKEILVRGSTEPALVRRSPYQIVQAANGSSERKGAVAARKLPSGDVIVTFQDTKTKDWYTGAGNLG